MSDDLATLEGVGVFNRMLGDLVAIGGPGTNTDRVVRDEVGHLLETCIRYTPTARAEIIDQRVLYKERKLYSAYSGGDTGKVARAQPTFISQGQQNTKAWYVAPNYTGRAKSTHRRQRDSVGNVTHAWHQMNGSRRWPDALWAEYQREEADRQQDYEAHLQLEKQAGRAARGLSARSWFDIADALGIGLRIDQYIRHAVPSDGQTYTNGHGRREVEGDAITYFLENFQPILLKNGGAEIAERAIESRLRAFDIAVENGLFADMLFLEKRYPALLAA